MTSPNGINKDNAILHYEDMYFFPISRDHLTDIKNWRNTQMSVLRQSKPLTDQNQENWFESISVDASQVLFSIGINEENSISIIGYCGLTNIDYISRRAEISFLINTNRSKKKLLYRNDFLKALTLLCQYAFDMLNMNKLFTETFAFRDEHIKILEDFGLKREGVLRMHQFKNGQYFDSIMHSILRDEWYVMEGKRK